MTALVVEAGAVLHLTSGRSRTILFTDGLHSCLVRNSLVEERFLMKNCHQSRRWFVALGMERFSHRKWDEMSWFWLKSRPGWGIIPTS